MLKVINCGQGNWNEVHSDSHIIFYDFGASQRYTAGQITSLISSRMSKIKNKKFTIVISHWDLDHFQALRHCTVNDLSNCSAIYGPSNIPNTIVYNDVVSKMSSYKIPFFGISSTSNEGRAIKLSRISSTRSVDVYRAGPGRSRNQTGIVLAIKGRDKVAILTGDHHYPKILNAINGKYSGREIIMVTPHHGGNAGKLVVDSWNEEFSSVTCPISVGDNSYGHPGANINELRRLEGAPPAQTIIDGDLCYHL